MEPREHPDSIERIARGIDRTLTKMGGDLEHKLGILGTEVKNLHQVIEKLTEAIEVLTERLEGMPPRPNGQGDTPARTD